MADKTTLFPIGLTGFTGFLLGRTAFCYNRDKEALPGGAIDLIACSRTRPNDTDENRRKGVHFFVDDYRFDVLRRKPDAGLEKYRQYAFILSPDFSRYNEMPVWKVIEAVGMNRWMGAYWQSRGMKVIPSVGWATPFTYHPPWETIRGDARQHRPGQV